jgi:hypothetical protein
LAQRRHRDSGGNAKGHCQTTSVAPEVTARVLRRFCTFIEPLLTSFFGSSSTGLEIACLEIIEISAKLPAICRQLRYGR